jgi:hypothetical protein
MTAETLCWVAVGVMAGCAVGVVALIFWETRSPAMELRCPKCGVVHSYDDNGNCHFCGVPVELWEKKGGA